VPERQWQNQTTRARLRPLWSARQCRRPQGRAVLLLPRFFERREDPPRAGAAV